MGLRLCTEQASRTNVENDHVTLILRVELDLYSIPNPSLKPVAE